MLLYSTLLCYFIILPDFTLNQNNDHGDIKLWVLYLFVDDQTDHLGMSSGGSRRFFPWDMSAQPGMMSTH